MPKFELDVQWTMTAKVVVEAESVHEAWTLAHTGEVPKDGVYLDDSFHLNSAHEIPAAKK